VAAPRHPFDGQAGPAAGPADVARAREPSGPAGPADPVDVERPARRDQPEAALANPFDDAAGPGLGGRSSGGAVRPPPSVSGMVLLRAWPIGLATRRESELTSLSGSAAGRASGRSRDA
jgi:hypothetical protein